MSQAVPSPPVGDIVRQVLVDSYGCLKHGAKLLARHAGGTPRAAENWLYGHNTPNAEALVNIMKNCRAMREAIFKIASETDP